MNSDPTPEFAVASLGALRMRASWRSEDLHSSPHNRLFWITRGTARHSVNCITCGYGPNTAIFVPPETMFSIELPAQVQGLMLQMPADPYLRLPEASLLLRISQIESQGMLTGYIDNIEREIAAAAPAMDRALAGHSLLISTWIERMLARYGNAQTRNKAHLLVENFASLMENQFRQGHSVADFAALLGVTPTHLSRVCRSAAGRPAHALLTERLTSEARRLLADTKMSAKDIADYLGYSSPAYFTRAFSQESGKTPSAFRAGLAA